MRRSDFLNIRITEKRILIAILLLAAILRFWGLGSQEFYHDEGFKAFRSIGYLDYIQNEDQTTPVQWFKNAPAISWWTSLSFHDHPPLFFLIQNLFFKIFGISFFAARLPSALAGIASVYLVYLIFRRSDLQGRAGLFVAFLLSISLIHIWISRSSLMEAFQVFLILLNIYYFLKIWGDPTSFGGRISKDWWLFGLTLGLAFLTKYTSAFLVPVYLTYWTYQSYWSNESYKSNWSNLTHLLSAFGLALLLFSPVLVYNFYLYQTVGHFDLQLSYLFGQETPEWRVSLGKLQDPFSEIISNLTLMYSIPFLLATLASIVWAIYSIFNSIFRTSGVPNIEISTFGHRKPNYLLFWLLNFLFITLMLIKVGSAFRFIVLYAVPAVMLIAYFFDYLYSRFNKEIFFKILVVAFLAYELFWGTDIFRTFPDFGIVKLDQYLDSELDNFRSLAVPSSPNPHLDKIIRGYALKIPPADHPIAIIYDENFGLSPRLWLFTRRNYYHGIPAITVDQFKKFLKEEGAERFRGYQLYFVKASPYTILNPLFSTPAAKELEAFLVQELNLSPAKLIHSRTGYLMFTVYKFNL